MTTNLRRISLGLTVAVIALSSPRSFAWGDDEEVRATIDGSSWHWTPQEWTYDQTYREIHDYADRPDAETLNTITVNWQPPTLDQLGNFCILRGQLRVPTTVAGQTRATDWFQGVTVYMAKQPDTKPDWSDGMNQEDTLSETVVTNPSGEFTVRIDTRETRYNRAAVEPFQFGLALAEHRNLANTQTQRVVWSSHSPAIPATVEMLVVPAADDLSREMGLLNRASGWPFHNPNGVDLIQAVNALQPLGKERALAILEEYVQLTASFDYSEEQELAFWIIRLLFEPVRLHDRIRAPAIAVYLTDPTVPSGANWPLNPMALVDDIPFMVGRQIAMGGLPEHPSSHIEWARHHGVMRDEPLRPSANPLKAAEAILHSSRFRLLDEYAQEEAKRLLRQQAMAMAGALLPPITAQYHDDAGKERQWKERLQKARSIEWDAESETFTVPQ